MTVTKQFCLALSLLAASALAALAQTAPAPSTAAPADRAPGLYMTFQTDLGDIPCKLLEAEAPVTVRTMVGLAIGKMPYGDPRTVDHSTGKVKLVRSKFFDGLTFHRVIPGFMIQGGDPLGTGLGSPVGPGFPFKNEVLPGLLFTVPGRLAMANAGPDTNASQFFITEGPQPSLNGGYTIWGQCENVEVVKAIARVPRDSNDKPKTPVHIKHVLVERVGPAPANAPEAMPARPSASGNKPATPSSKAKTPTKPAN